MRPRHYIALAAFATLALAPGMRQGASAQEAPKTSSWHLGLWAHTGYQHPSGRFATNKPTEVRELELLEAIARFGASRLIGGGVELAPPAQDFSLRVGWETTTGAEATGSIAICDIADGALCEKEVAPLDMRGLLVEGRSIRGGPEKRLATVVLLGFGARWYAFSVPDCSGKTGNLKLVCDAITDIYRDPKTHLVLRLGLGMRAHLGGLWAELGSTVGTGRYSGGVGQTEGLWYQEVRINLSVGATLF